jgi:hypothetical protein
MIIPPWNARRRNWPWKTAGAQRAREGSPGHISQNATSGPRRPNPSFVRVARDSGAIGNRRLQLYGRTTRTVGSASSGRPAQKPCRKSAGGAIIAVQAND